VTLNYKPDSGGDDLTITSRHYSTPTQQQQQQLRQVPVRSEPRPETTASTLGSRVRRTQSSNAVQRSDQTVDFTRQNGSLVADGTYRLGSTYDEGINIARQ